jgi:hypothetical protein
VASAFPWRIITGWCWPGVKGCRPLKELLKRGGGTLRIKENLFFLQHFCYHAAHNPSNYSNNTTNAMITLNEGI